MAEVEFDQELIKRYDKSGPRYTSYPTAVQFTEDYTETDYRRHAELSNQSDRALSLYFHLPFCDTICYYCACNKIITKDRSKADPYLTRLHKEIEMQGKLFDNSRKVNQLHWGGGTPTFISHDQMRELMTVTRKHFNLHDDDSGEYSIEIDPREVTSDSIQLLRDIGFNRMSLGVQDFNPVVQKAVNRIQSEDQTLGTLESARRVGFKSISVDLIYGLPFQTVESFAATLERIIEINPDRLSIFNYAHLPSLFKPQRRINEDELPSPLEKLDILKMTIERLSSAGYVYIGMDHFAKPDDELAIAQQNNLLYRNFQGYATHADCDLIGLGITSIGTVGRSFAQNVKTMDEYIERIDAGKLAVFRGVEIDDDDIIRRNAIMQLICHFDLNIADFECKNNIKFTDYFKDEIVQLTTMKNDGLIEFDENKIQVTAKGRLLIRNICMVFDRYLKKPQKDQRYSKAI
ncbi:MAG: oxygen-independent coproporphyrinogen III oxidase [Gammaproteobacteria bacterium]|nr:oxygen-independent coproporphyrinogen III oxidase [Gammaproteobacteria bacterium]MCW9005863.1 oxygen-independent coproporphyrinogen III oxidase [Gammaproteobacteria bacterium]MCW9055331.1 oxygen-independent coproporphyrinogen III oxidase [Gammaproteobacteria bacterium]